jgi:hypothetical protein
MTRQKFLALTLVVASASLTANAASLGSFLKGAFHPNPQVATAQNSDMVRVSFRNWKFAPHTIVIGSSTFRLDPDSTRTFDITAGTPVYAIDKKGAQTMLLNVSQQDKGRTVVIN